MQYMC